MLETQPKKTDFAPQCENLEKVSAHGELPQSIPLRRLWWAAFVLLALATGAVGWTVWQLRNDAIRAAASDAGNIAAVLASQLARSLNSIDGTLLEVKRSSKELNIDDRQNLRDAFNREEMHNRLKHNLAQVPNLFNIVIADEEGQVAVSTSAWPTPAINVADRDYFKSARARVDDQLTISVPFANRVDASLTIVFARRLENSSGKFVGVIFASANFGYFEAIYQSTESINSVLFTLVRQDGIILYRHPDAQGFIGRTLSGSATFHDAVTKGARSYRIQAQADGNVRYVSLQQVSDYPLFVNISVAEDVALAAWLRRSATIGFGSATLVLCSICLLIAISRQVRRLGKSEAALRKSTQIVGAMNMKFDAALNNMAQGLMMFNGAGMLTTSNRRIADLFGMPWERWQIAALGKTFPQAMQLAYELTDVTQSNGPQVIAEFQNILSRHTTGTLSFERTDGRIFSATCAPVTDGGFVVTFEEITERRRIEDQISRMAHYDALTDLPNRALFYQKMDKLLTRKPEGGTFAVLSLDLDHFKSVNDTLGHPVGDRLLQAVAERMRGCVRETDMVARLGGDEFAILQATFSQSADASSLATRLIEAVSAPYQLDGHQVVVGTSVGIAIAPGDGTASDQLMKNADLALYRCKAGGGSRYQFFETKMDAGRAERRALELDLRKALLNGEFTLNYQPIVNLKTGKITACEALIRWRQPERGLVSPLDFIPIAEETGLIEAIGEWVLGHACADATEWPNDITVTVNVSPVQFRDSDFIRVVTSALKKSRLPSSRLELEITELVLIQDSDAALAVLRQLKDLGTSIAMDDFGTGHSSLGYLRSFPFDRIKIDQSFIRDLPESKDSLAIIRAVVGLGRSLGIVTTAEGVETQDQLEVLRTEGCTEVQGYLFSQPKSAVETRDLLTSLSSQVTAVA